MIEQEMLEEQYLTISAFAKLVGVSHQAIYKGLRNRLQPYVQELQGRKLISIRAASLFESTEVAQLLDESATVAQVADSNFTVQFLQKQLEEKDRQLKAKDRQMEEKDKQITSLLDTLQQQTSVIQQLNTLSLADKKTMHHLTEGDWPDDEQPVRPDVPGGQEQKETENSQARKWFQFWK